MDLLDILTPECVKAPLVAQDKRGVIDELVDVLAAVGKATDPQSLKDAVWAREETRTTGIGYSLAIPHGKCSGVSDLAMAIGKPSEPIDFKSIDRKPVKLVVLLASPVDRTSDHIQALARISRLMTQEEFREKIYLAGSSQEIYDLLAEQEKALIESAAT
jgi:fructose-specific phosphotransferase system IIA component